MAQPDRRAKRVASRLCPALAPYEICRLYTLPRTSACLYSTRCCAVLVLYSACSVQRVGAPYNVYGSKARYRARLMANATFRWFLDFK